MSNRLKELRERRGTIVKDMRQIVAAAELEKRDMTPVEADKHSELFREQELLRGQIEEEERNVELDRDSANRIGAQTEQPAFVAHSPEVRVNRRDLAEERSALEIFARTGDDRQLRNINRRAMSANSDLDGGYLVVPAISATMASRLWNQTPVRRLSRNVSITTGDVWEEPLDMDETTAVWTAETPPRPATDTPSLGLLRVPVNEIYALQPITQRLLDSSYTDLGAWIEGKITDKFARSEGAAFVIGDGVQKPKGFMTYGIDAAADIARDNAKLQYVPSGKAAAITADSLRDLYWAMRAVHRSDATWLMASSTANHIDKLKNGDGSYLWRDSSAAGVPPTLLGRPVEFCEDMPEVAENTFPVAFGDFGRGYVVVDQVGLRLLRDPYTDKPNVLFYAYRRVGGGVANSDAIKLLKVAAA